MDKIMLRIKKKLKSWESVLYFESQLYTIFSISIDESYKVIDVYLSNIHFHNTDTLIARSIDTPVISELNQVN